MSDSFYEVILSCIRLSDKPGGIKEWIFSLFSVEFGKSISKTLRGHIVLF